MSFILILPLLESIIQISAHLVLNLLTLNVKVSYRCRKDLIGILNRKTVFAGFKIAGWFFFCKRECFETFKTYFSKSSRGAV